LLWTALVLPPAAAISTNSTTADKGRVKEAKERAAGFAKKGDWGRAYRDYDKIVRNDRNDVESRRALEECFRRYQQSRRHRDATYRKLILDETPSYAEVMQILKVMLKGLQIAYVDKTRPVPSRLFLRGKEELAYALQDEFFWKSFAKFDKKEIANFRTNLARFKTKLSRDWDGKNIKSVEQLVDEVRDIAMTAQRAVGLGGLSLSAKAVALEFACGACAALDQYTLYLTPGQFSALFSSTRGAKVIGIGIDLCIRDTKLLISRVWWDSPAKQAGLKVDDEVIRIDKKLTAGITPEAARDLLKGRLGAPVELEVASPGMASRTVTLKRQRLTPSSVEYGWLWEKVEMSMDPGKQTEIGYIQISHFQKTTPAELDTAIMALRDGGLKGLILDLRGNKGGSFEAAVDCARRFLTSGIIVRTMNREAKVKDHMVRNGSINGLLTKEEVPMVVLVDRYTESSAEVLAIALRENNRAKLIGQTTFGKACSQTFVPLRLGKDKTVGAIYITVEKFYSPKGNSYGGRGIEPDYPADNEDDQLAQARQVIKDILNPPMPQPMVKMPSP
jgi:carboxyl-terminal processing protease